MSETNGKVCCNCRRCKRITHKNTVNCYCEIDNRYLPYITVMEHWCRHWAKEKGEEE